MTSLSEEIRCSLCGRKLGVVGDGYLYIHHKGRSIKIVPTEGSTCRVVMTCENKTCRKKKFILCLGLTQTEKMIT